MSRERSFQGPELKFKGCVKRSFEEKWESGGIMDSQSYGEQGLKAEKRQVERISSEVTETDKPQ